MPHVKYMFDNDNVVINNTFVDIVPRKEEIIRFENVYVPVVIVTHCAITGETHIILDQGAVCCVSPIEGILTEDKKAGDMLTSNELQIYVNRIMEQRDQ